MSTDPLTAAIAEYRAIVEGPVRPPAQMLASARAFARRIEELAAAGDAGQRILDAALRDSNSLNDRAAMRATVAARILSAIPSPRAAELLVAVFTHDNRLDTRDLVRLAKTQHFDRWPARDAVPERVQGDLAIAIARSDTPLARQLLDDIVGGRHPLSAEHVIPLLAARGDLDRLRLLAELHPSAASYLALAGDRGAVDQLVAMTQDARHASAGPAVAQLALLGQPSAVAATRRALKARRLETVALALDAAGTLGTPLLGEALLELAAARQGVAAYGTSPVSADATRVIEELTGANARNPLALRTELSAMDPALRYSGGTPLNLARLAVELSSAHVGPRMRAAWGLRAATGEDHGYDLEDDLAAIDAWTTRARDPEPMGAGNWGFLGKRLSAP